MFKSILLTLDGSQESLFAADIALSLAEKRMAALTGLTVVDSQSLWEIVGQDLPGIIGSGPYMAAYQTIESSLRAVAEMLIVAFETRVASRPIGVTSIIEQGSVIDHILQQAGNHDLIIMGHKPKERQRSIHQRRYFSSSLCQRIAESCTVPLLVVQNSTKLWTRSKLVISADTYNSQTFSTFIELSACHGGQAEIVCTGRSKTIDELVNIARTEVDKTGSGERISVVGKSLYELEEFFATAGAQRSETLIVLTTCDTEQGRKVCTGESLSSLIRDVEASCTLFLPPNPTVLTDTTDHEEKHTCTVTA